MKNQTDQKRPIRKYQGMGPKTAERFLKRNHLKIVEAEMHGWRDCPQSFRNRVIDARFCLAMN